MPRPPRTLTALPTLSLGDAVRVWRRRRGWTQQELADRAGLGRETVVALERSSDYSTRRTVFKVAAAFGCTPDALAEIVSPAFRVNGHAGAPREEYAAMPQSAYELQLIGILRSLTPARQRELCTLASDFAAGRVDGAGTTTDTTKKISSAASTRPRARAPRAKKPE